MEREKHLGATSYESPGQIEINKHREYWLLYKNQNLKVV